MLITLPTNEFVLVDDQKLPRYWPAVWAMLHCTGLATSTVKLKLRHIDALYLHSDSIGCELDDALSEQDFAVLGSALEAYFVSLRNAPTPSSKALVKWNTAFHFVRDTCERISRNPASGKKMDAVRDQMSRLDRLYLGLRPYRKRFGGHIRALPRLVISELLDAAMPGSDTNPFEHDATQWRVYCLVMLLLYQGLRRGEALSLKADALQTQRDPKTSDFRWLLAVRTNEGHEELRADAPSVKTAASIRTIPVTAVTAEVIQAYLENYRGKVNHSYLLSSARQRPLSLEGVSKIFQKLTEALSPAARAELLNLTGAPLLTGHALRHTCAVLRMKQMLQIGQTPEFAMAQLRSFFGWSKTSVMPLHYAKAALDERLNETWNDKLDSRLEILRSVPR